MWTSRTERLPDIRAIKVAVELDASPVPYAEVLQRWREDPDFRTFFIDLLADAPFTVFRWETPPITTANAGRAFEFVLLDSPYLDLPPEEHDFAEHFHDSGPEDVVEFPNLGGDAVMVAPCPGDPPSAYGHLAAFSRQAPAAQQHALWQLVGAAMLRRLGTKPVWLSTAGGGVAWLHVRLDDRPKYYGYAPYRQIGA